MVSGLDCGGGLKHCNMSFTERDLTGLFHKYLRTEKPANLQHSYAIEFKIKKGNQKLHLTRDFQPQQLGALQQVADSCLYHKLSDMSMGIKPFDGVSICHSKAYIGVLWYKPREPKLLYLIPIQQIKSIIDLGEKSISEFAAEKVSDHIIKL